jgi:threonine dehydrogenase-like Zn-dependent dehydrogenase
MPKRILIQLDCDPQPSTFDAVVAVDAGADVLLRHGGVTPENVVPLVHGGMFTRGGADLASTAIFIGGSDVPMAEAVAARVRETFFGPVRMGVLVDPSGANTTAAAAVVAAARHLPLQPGEKPQCRALVLGGTGPVGQRVARLLARRGAAVSVASRNLSRAEEVVSRIAAVVPQAAVSPRAPPAESHTHPAGRIASSTVPPYGLPAASAATSHAPASITTGVFDGQTAVLLPPKENKLITGAAAGAARRSSHGVLRARIGPHRHGQAA